MVVCRATRRAQFSDEAALTAESPAGPSKRQRLVAETRFVFLAPGMEVDHYLAARLCASDGPHAAVNNDGDLVHVTGQPLLGSPAAGGLAIMLGKTIGGPCRAAVLAAAGGDDDYARAQNAASARLQLRQHDVDEAEAAKAEAVALLVRAYACSHEIKSTMATERWHLSLLLITYTRIVVTWCTGDQGTR
jgi:hypothetical protein